MKLAQDTAIAQDRAKNPQDEFGNIPSAKKAAAPKPSPKPSPPPRPSRSSPRQQPPPMQLKSTQTQRRKPGEPRRQAGGRTPTHLHFHGLQLLLSSSRRRHPPHLIMTGHEVAEKPAAGNEVLVSLQELAAPRIRLGRPTSRKQMRTASGRARIEAEGVHGDGAKSRTRHEKQIRCLAEWIRARQTTRGFRATSRSDCPAPQGVARGRSRPWFVPP